MPSTRRNPIDRAEDRQLQQVMNLSLALLPLQDNNQPDKKSESPKLGGLKLKLKWKSQVDKTATGQKSGGNTIKKKGRPAKNTGRWVKNTGIKRDVVKKSNLEPRDQLEFYLTKLANDAPQQQEDFFLPPEMIEYVVASRGQGFDDMASPDSRYDDLQHFDTNGSIYEAVEQLSEADVLDIVTDSGDRATIENDQVHSKDKSEALRPSVRTRSKKRPAQPKKETDEPPKRKIYAQLPNDFDNQVDQMSVPDSRSEVICQQTKEQPIKERAKITLLQDEVQPEEIEEHPFFPNPPNKSPIAMASLPTCKQILFSEDDSKEPVTQKVEASLQPPSLEEVDNKFTSGLNQSQVTVNTELDQNLTPSKDQPKALRPSIRTPNKAKMVHIARKRSPIETRKRASEKAGAQSEPYKPIKLSNNAMTSSFVTAGPAKCKKSAENEPVTTAVKASVQPPSVEEVDNKFTSGLNQSQVPANTNLVQTSTPSKDQPKVRTGSKEEPAKKPKIVHIARKRSPIGTRKRASEKAGAQSETHKPIKLSNNAMTSSFVTAGPAKRKKYAIKEHWTTAVKASVQPPSVEEGDNKFTSGLDQSQVPANTNLVQSSTPSKDQPKVRTGSKEEPSKKPKMVHIARKRSPIETRKRASEKAGAQSETQKQIKPAPHKPIKPANNVMTAGPTKRKKYSKLPHDFDKQVNQMPAPDAKSDNICQRRQFESIKEKMTVIVDNPELGILMVNACTGQIIVNTINAARQQLLLQDEVQAEVMEDQPYVQVPNPPKSPIAKASLPMETVRKLALSTEEDKMEPEEPEKPEEPEEPEEPVTKAVEPSVEEVDDKMFTSCLDLGQVVKKQQQEVPCDAEDLTPLASVQGQLELYRCLLCDKVFEGTFYHRAHVSEHFEIVGRDPNNEEIVLFFSHHFSRLENSNN
jgi:hypothetical protein